MTPPANPPYRFGDLLALARRTWIRHVAAAMERAGFPGYRQTDSWVLRLLVQQPMAIGQLGDAMGVTRQAARKLANGMVERGYATLSPDPADARRTMVVLTSAGEAYAWAVATTQDALNNRLRDRVSPEDLAAADRVLRAVFLSPNVRRRIDEAVPPPLP
jgi:DNA-binding MarR family transcriptional regulator